MNAKWGNNDAARKKKGGEREYLSKEIKSLYSRESIPERHCSTTQHDRASEFPQKGVRATHPLSSALQFHSPILNRAYTFLCILQVSLIMLNTNFNECLPRPVALGFFVCVAKLLQQGKCDFTIWSFNKVFMVTSFALSIFLQLWLKEEMNPNDTA